MIESLPFAARALILSMLFGVGSLACAETANSGAVAQVQSRDIEPAIDELLRLPIPEKQRRIGLVGTLTKPLVLAAEDKLDDLEKALKLREQAEPDRKRLEQQQKESDEQREKEEKERLEREEARLAPICEPLKNRVISALKNNRAGQGSFERIQEELRVAKEQMSTSCPPRVVIFDGSITAIIRCYNNAFLIKLANGEQYVGTKETFSFNGLPQRAGETVIGITDQHYFCIQSTAPLVVLTARHVNAMLRKKK